MSTDFGFTELECKIITAQIERRAKFRKMFLKAKSDPCKHSMQAGYVVSILLYTNVPHNCYRFSYTYRSLVLASYSARLLLLPNSPGSWVSK